MQNWYPEDTISLPSNLGCLDAGGLASPATQIINGSTLHAEGEDASANDTPATATTLRCTSQRPRGSLAAGEHLHYFYGG